VKTKTEIRMIVGIAITRRRRMKDSILKRLAQGRGTAGTGPAVRMQKG
jgi:hypothetical protein